MEDSRIQIGEKQFLIGKVRDIDALFDEYIKANGGNASEEQIPYWAELWHSAIGLAAFIADQPELVKGRSVHELGCGLGLPGIVAGSLGAKEVEFSDLLPEPLEQVISNWKLNLQGTPKVSLLDFSTTPVPEGSDLILASDIAYERRLFPAILKRFSEINSSADILFSEPGRELCKGFFEQLKEAGFKLKTHFREVDYKDLKINILIHFIAKKPGP